MLGTHDPRDHQHWAAEKRSPPGTFEPKLDTEICNCGAKRFAYQSGDPATAWFIRPMGSKESSI